MKNTCKTLANLALVLGAIGSGLLAKTFGQRLDFDTLEMVRDSTRTAAIFVSTLFGVVIIWALLYAAGKILENQECIIELLKHSKPDKTPIAQENKPLCGIPNGVTCVSDNSIEKSVAHSTSSPTASVSNKRDEWGSTALGSVQIANA